MSAQYVSHFESMPFSDSRALKIPPTLSKVFHPSVTSHTKRSIHCTKERSLSWFLVRAETGAPGGVSLRTNLIESAGISLKFPQAVQYCRIIAGIVDEAGATSRTMPGESWGKDEPARGVAKRVHANWVFSEGGIWGAKPKSLIDVSMSWQKALGGGASKFGQTGNGSFPCTAE